MKIKRNKSILRINQINDLERRIEMTKKSKRKKKEIIFEIILWILIIIAFTLFFFFGKSSFEGNKLLSEKLGIFLSFIYGPIYIALVFYILPYLFFKDEMRIGEAKKVIKKNLNIETYSELEEKFSNTLKERNIEIGEFECQEYSAIFGIYNEKQYAIVEGLIYLKEITPSVLKDYQKNCFDKLCTYIGTEKKYLKYKKRFKNTLLIICVDNLDENMKELIKSDIHHFFNFYRFPVFISLEDKKIYIPVQKSELGIGEWRKIKKIFDENYKSLIVQNVNKEQTY